MIRLIGTWIAIHIWIQNQILNFPVFSISIIAFHDIIKGQGLWCNEWYLTKNTCWRKIPLVLEKILLPNQYWLLRIDRRVIVKKRMLSSVMIMIYCRHRNKWKLPVDGRAQWVLLNLRSKLKTILPDYFPIFQYIAWLYLISYILFPTWPSLLFKQHCLHSGR